MTDTENVILFLFLFSQSIHAKRELPLIKGVLQPIDLSVMISKAIDDMVINKTTCLLGLNFLTQGSGSENELRVIQQLMKQFDSEAAEAVLNEINASNSALQE